MEKETAMTPDSQPKAAAENPGSPAEVRLGRAKHCKPHPDPSQPAASSSIHRAILLC